MNHITRHYQILAEQLEKELQFLEEKLKAKLKAKRAKKKLDPLGRRDGDINNDGRKNKIDQYLYTRRDAVSDAIQHRNT